MQKTFHLILPVFIFSDEYWAPIVSSLERILKNIL